MQVAEALRRIGALSLLSLGLAILTASGFTRAEQADDIQAGKELAIIRCSHCHAVTPQDQSAQLPAPSFVEIAKGNKAEPQSLRIFLLSTHSNVGHPGAMPSPALTEDQIRTISAYLSSLKGAK